ncbi:MAG TPA: SGNH/GDSL hydrolase family protein [Actinomycetota bacterium]
METRAAGIEEHPPPLSTWLLAAALILAGVAVISLAVTTSAPVIGAIGIVLSTGGLILLNTCIVPLAGDHRLACYVIGTALVLGGLALIAWSFERSAWIVGVGVAAAAVGWLPVRAALIRQAGGKQGATGEETSRTSLRFVLLGIGLTVGSGVAFALGPHLPRAPLVAVLFVGLALYRFGIEPLCDRGDPKRWTIIGCAVAVPGLILVVLGGRSFALTALMLGLLLLFFGLLPLTIGWSRQGLRPFGRGWTVGIAIAVGSVGVALWPTLEPNIAHLVLAGLLVLLALSFSWRAELLVVVIVAGFVVVWVSIDRTDPSPLDPNPNAGSRILALGDSYASGEGATAFLPGTNVVGEFRNQCRRSSTAYPYLVAERLHMGLDFFACSGATTSDIDETGQMGPESPDDVVGERPQLDNLDGDFSRIAAVLVTIGGNDARFGKIGIACVLPGSCAELRETLLVNVAHIGADITSAFQAIKDAVGPNVPIVAVPYPLLLTEQGCGWSALRPSEHDFLVEFITVLDDRIRRSAELVGINFFEQGLFAFENEKICDQGAGPDEAATNFFNLHPTEGDFAGRINPKNWVHGTFHPKPEGHEAIADLLEPWLRMLLADVEAGGPANPEPDPEATFTVRRVSSVETVLADRRDLPTTLDCPVDELSGFATLLPLIDADDPFPLHASDQDPICYTRPDGTWTTWRPTDPPNDVVSVNDGVISIQPQLPAVERFPNVDRSQRLIYKGAGPDGRWQLQIVEFCRLKEGCDYDPVVWIKDQIRASTGAMVIPAVLVFFGGWLFGVGLRKQRGAGSPPHAQRG